MNSSRPYLLRAFYDWIIDNKYTPYVVINSEFPGVDVPQEYVEDGRIVLNIAPGAVRSLTIANDHLEFHARFSGIPHEIYAPMRAISAIYAKENGRGMVFKDDEDFPDEPPPGDDTRGKGGSSGSNSGPGSSSKGGDKKPKLTVVK